MNQISTFLTLFLLCLTSNSFVNAQTVGFYAPMVLLLTRT